MGQISRDYEAQFGASRFIGPIFASTVTFAHGREILDFPCFDGGTAAFEAEILAVIGSVEWAHTGIVSPAEARNAIGTLHIGIEVAGSPLTQIQNLGPLVSIAAFGNNAGLIVGPAIEHWNEAGDVELDVKTQIAGGPVKHGVVADLPGGIWAAVAFAINTAEQIGRPLQGGDIISTGALTGVNPVKAGINCLADFGALGILSCLTSVA